MEEFFRGVGEKALSGEGICREEALRVLAVPPESIFRLLSVTDPVRRRFRGDAIRLCSIVNAKSGGCSEDCSFCAQSRRSSAPSAISSRSSPATTCCARSGRRWASAAT